VWGTGPRYGMAMARSDARMRLLDAALVALVAHGAGVFDDNLARWCRVNGVSRATAYRHLKRVRERGRWEPDSTRPRTRVDHATPLEVEAEVVRLRRELAEQPGEEVGADNVRYYLTQLAALDGWAERGWTVPSRATVHKIMKRHGLVRPEPAIRRAWPLRRLGTHQPVPVHDFVDRGARRHHPAALGPAVQRRELG